MNCVRGNPWCQTGQQKTRGEHRLTDCETVFLIVGFTKMPFADKLKNIDR